MLDRVGLLEQERRRRRVAGVADCQTHHLGRKSTLHAQIEKVLVLGHQQQGLFSGPLTDGDVAGNAKAGQAHVEGAGEPFDQ